MELIRVASEGGRNCMVVTDKPCMHLFVDGMANFGLNSTKKSIVVAQCNDVPIKGTTATLQVSITAAKDASRMFDDIQMKAQPIATGVYVSMLPGTDKHKMLHIRVNFDQIVNLNPANKQVINLSNKALGKHSGLSLNATVSSPDGFSVADMAEKPEEPPAPPVVIPEPVAAPVPPPAAKKEKKEKKVEPVVQPIVEKVVEALSPAIKAPPPAPLEVKPTPAPVPVVEKSPKFVEPSNARQGSTENPGRLVRSQSMRMEAVDDNFTIDNTDKRYVRVIVTFDQNAVSGDRYSFNRGLGGIGYTIVVSRTDRVMGNAGAFQPAPKSHNLEFTEDCGRRQLVLRFDRSKDVTAQAKNLANGSSRVCASTEGTVSLGCADVKFVAMYVFDEVKDNAYFDAVHALLHPRPQHGLTGLKMNEVTEEVLLKLSIRQPATKHYAAIRDAVRQYMSNVNLRRSNTMKWRSHDF